MGRSYRDLIAWQKAMKFVTQIYEVTLEISERGALRTHQSIAASVRLGTKQYRRRTGSLLAKRVSSLFEYGAWISGRN